MQTVCECCVRGVGGLSDVAAVVNDKVGHRLHGL